MATFSVFLVVLVDLIGFGIVLPLLPFYADKFQASPVAIGLLYSVYSLAQLIFSPFWGNLSDKVGRRPIMLISTFGSFLSYLLFSFSSSFALLFASRLLAGVMGGNISTAQSYMTDVTGVKDRAKAMGLIGAAFGIGFVMGPAITVLLARPAFANFFGLHDAYVLPGFAAATLSLVSFLMVLFKLPETVTPEKRKAGETLEVTRRGALSIDFWRNLPELTEPGEARKKLLPLLLAMFLVAFAHSNLYSTFPLFCRAQHGMNAQSVGMLFVWIGILAAMIQGGLIRLLVKYFNERKLFLTGSFLLVAGLACIPTTSNFTLMVGYLSLMTVGASLTQPTLMSMLSQKARPTKIGAMMGASQSLSALGRTIGPAWGGYLFGYSHSLPFLATALCASLMIWVGFKLIKN